MLWLFRNFMICGIIWLTCWTRRNISYIYIKILPLISCYFSLYFMRISWNIFCYRCKQCQNIQMLKPLAMEMSMTNSLLLLFRVKIISPGKEIITRFDSLCLQLRFVTKINPSTFGKYLANEERHFICYVFLLFYVFSKWPKPHQVSFRTWRKSCIYIRP